MKLTDLAKVVDIGLSLLTQRILTLLTLVMTFILFCVAIREATWIHLAVSGGFGIIVFLPVLIADRRPKEAVWQNEPAQ
jgi:hypothetical protein